MVHNLDVQIPVSISEVYTGRYNDLVSAGLEPENAITDHLYTRPVAGFLGECADILIQNKLLSGVGLYELRLIHYRWGR